jgi:parallel beta-helix repeat protein
MSYNYYGVWPRFDSAENVISGNNITHGNRGIFLDASPNNTMSGNRIAFVADGVYTNNSRSNIITGNSISTSGTAIYLKDWSPYNTITRNTLDNNTRGIQVQLSHSNIIVGNTIVRNLQYGVLLFLGTSSTLVHNSFLGNTQHVRAYLPTVHVWDNGVEGNYWSNYTGADADHDGVGDTPHVIDANNTDYYPLMGAFYSFNTSVGECVNVISNSTVTYFNYWETHERIIIQVRNATTDQTSGFCRISIPLNLTDPELTWVSVFIDDGTVTPLLLNTTLYDNGTHRWIYVAYPHPYSLHEIVVIIPEFPSFLLLPLFMISTLLAVMVYRRRARARRLIK